MLRCPPCNGEFARTDGALRCPAGHAYDVAREGYVNLLAGGRALAPEQGDSAQMLAARRRFLASGAYDPLLSAVSEAVASHLAARPPSTDRPSAILDAGCGEGAYLSAVGLRLDTGTCRAGVDIAKAAVRMAARRDAGALFLVADLWRGLPLADGAFDVLLNVFAPRNPAEFARVLRPDGLLLVVVPAPDHLAELRAGHDLIGIEAEKEHRVVAQFSQWFRLADAATLRHPLALAPAQLADLLAMTPSARHGVGEAALTPDPSPNSGRGEEVAERTGQLRKGRASLQSAHPDSGSPSPSIGRGGQGVRAITSVTASFRLLSFTRNPD